MTVERLKQVLLILNDGRFHSGAQLGHSLNITRSAIWKMTKQLEKYNIELESVVGRGYRLKQPISFLSIDDIKQQLSPQATQAIKKIDVFNSIPSTEEYLSSRIYETSKLPRVCLTEHLCQPKPKSTADKQKQSIAQKIDLSCLWPFAINSDLNGLGIVIGVALTQVLDQLGIVKHLTLHWPNTLCYQQQPLAQFNVETKAVAQQSQYGIINLSLNVNFPDKTSLQQIKHKAMDRNIIASKLINQLCYCLSIFQKSGISLFIDEWKQQAAATEMPVEQLIAQRN